MAANGTKAKWGDREARRSDILAAARRLLERDGYERLSIRDVAAGAGVSPGTVYTYFASREGLFGALYAERLERFHAQIAPACASARTPHEVFRAIADAYLDMYRVYGREVNMWAALLERGDGDVALPPPAAQALVGAAVKVLDTVQAAIGRFTGERTAQEAKLTLPFLWATLTGLADHFTGRRHNLYAYTWDEMVDFAAGVLVAGMTRRSIPT
jgi:AcrR family transcriptional regulator